MNRRVSLGLLIVALLLVGGAFYLGRPGPPAGGETLLHSATAARHAPPVLARNANVRAKNLILVVGDGMGLTHVAAAQIALRGPEGRLWMQTLPDTALVRTHSASNLVTDSAAGATALATGTRVANGVVSVDAQGAPLPTLFERARLRGLSAGLVTTGRITDATPAAFSAHAGQRNDELRIAQQQATGGMEVLLGCEPEWFLPRARGGKRTDGHDLLEAMRLSGYAVTLDPAALAPSSSGRLVGLFAEENRPSLATLTKTAIETLRHDPDGFVLLVESEETDSAAHNHQLDRLLRGMADLDESVRLALEFAKSDGDTLVVVTADHETGGMSLVESKAAGALGVKWTTGKHTAQPVPLYAWGPGAATFRGEIDNTGVHALLQSALWLDATAPAGSAAVTAPAP